MLPDLSATAWVLHGACALLTVYFASWLVRATPRAAGPGEKPSPRDFRQSRLLTGALLVCSIASGVGLLGLGDGQQRPLLVSMVAFMLLGVAVGCVVRRADPTA